MDKKQLPLLRQRLYSATYHAACCERTKCTAGLGVKLCVVCEMPGLQPRRYPVVPSISCIRQVQLLYSSSRVKLMALLLSIGANCSAWCPQHMLSHLARADEDCGTRVQWLNSVPRSALKMHQSARLGKQSRACVPVTWLV